MTTTNGVSPTAQLKDGIVFIDQYRVVVVGRQCVTLAVFYEVSKGQKKLITLDKPRVQQRLLQCLESKIPHKAFLKALESWPIA